VWKNVVKYLNKAPKEYNIEVRTPQSLLLTDGPATDKKGHSPRAPSDVDLGILVIGQEDSRLPIVDLARTLGDMNKQGQLFPEDISIDLIHENMTGLILEVNLILENLMTEPDLLILFSPRVDLQGFPPWHIRLTEILYSDLCFR
jgi:undecaprenyl pyrophosphate synthase